jgi:hypothetical protein
MKKENFLTSNQFFLFCVCSICNNCNDDNLIVYFNVNSFFISVEICIIVQEIDAMKSHSSKAAGHTNKKSPGKKTRTIFRRVKPLANNCHEQRALQS